VQRWASPKNTKSRGRRKFFATVFFSYCYKITVEGRVYVAKQRGRGRVFGSFSEKRRKLVLAFNY